MPLLAIAFIAAGTYAFRLVGPLSRDRIHLPEQARRLLGIAAAVLLVALIGVGTLTEGHDFAGWSRPAGVLAAAVLAIRRAPFPVVVLTAIATTALLRLAGMP
ncbi:MULTISPECIES: AzlD domain-containing protein [unclassified Embleya]|uniref:AzlD domain-containing protein n=1 Tax=unclassified Embleya TaxID=2699296 RepID=UPI0033F568B8